MPTLKPGAAAKALRVSPLIDLLVLELTSLSVDSKKIPEISRDYTLCIYPDPEVLTTRSTLVEKRSHIYACGLDRESIRCRIE